MDMMPAARAFVFVTMLQATAMPRLPTASSCSTCAHGSLHRKDSAPDGPI
jgi:hypothetical protein